MTVTVYVVSPVRTHDSAEHRLRADVRAQLASIIGTERRLDLVVCDDGDAGDEAVDWCQDRRVRWRRAWTWWQIDPENAPRRRDAVVLTLDAPSWIVDGSGRTDWPETATVRRVGGAR